MGFFDNFPGLKTKSSTPSSSGEKQEKFETPWWVWLMIAIVVVIVVLYGIYDMRNNNSTKLKNINNN